MVTKTILLWACLALLGCAMVNAEKVVNYQDSVDFEIEKPCTTIPEVIRVVGTMRTTITQHYTPSNVL
jgi:hypothetical protein